MGKKKHDKKSKGDKPELSKKKLRKLEEREAAIRAELERRAEKKAKKSKDKKVKKSKPAPAVEADGKIESIGEMTIEPEAPVIEEPVEKSPHLLHLERVGKLHAIANDESAKPKDRKAAAAELEKLRVEGEKLNAERDAKRAARDAESDEAIKARVDAKRAERERKARLAEVQKDVEANGQIGKVRKSIADAEASAVGKVAEAVAAISHVVDEIETETGRVFEAGAAKAVDDKKIVEAIASPSDAPLVDFEVNGNGQYKIKRESDGRFVGYTRVTTYISCLEDTTALTKWKMRLLLEGVAAADGGETGDSVTDRVRALAHNRDVAIAKARKADKKGKLSYGDLGPLIERAWSDFKRGMDALADEVFEIGGGREKATKGTDIHALCDLHDREGITAVGDLLTEGKITPADMADVEAYAEAIRKLGAKILEAERVVVNDELKVAGRLDRVVLVKLPGEARARRRVLDIKTGRVDFGAGKIAQQLEMYAKAKGYDLNTHEREDLKLDQTRGLLLHLPAGTGTASVHVVDLGLGRRGNKLAGDVRLWRTEGKRAYDVKANVLDEIAAAEGGE